MLPSCAERAQHDHTLLEKAKNLFHRAAVAQNNGRYDEAVALYDSLLHTTTADPATNDSLLPIASKAVTQVMNTFQSQGKPEECVAYLQQLQRAHNVMTGAMCRRDISTTLAYAMSRTENVEGAVAEMDRAMRMKPVNPTPQRMFRDYAYATAVYYCLPERSVDVNRYGSLALQQIRLCDNRAGETWITAILGMSYMRSGELGNALGIFKQSYDSAAERGDTLSMANTLNLIANIMINWNLYDYANDYTSRAVEISSKVKDKNPKICSNILSNKALVMEKFGYIDSALIYLDRAHEFTKDLPYNSGNSDIDLVRGELYTKNPRTAAEGLRILHKVTAGATSGIRTKAYYLLAQYHINKGEFEVGEAALDSTITTMSINTSPILMNDIYEFALDHYVATGNKDKIAKLAADLNNSNKLVANSDILKQIAESVVEFKTRERSEELDWQQEQIEHKKVYIIVYSIIALVVFVAVTITLLIKRRYAMLRQKYAEQQLENLSYRLEAMAQDRQQLAQQLQSQHIQYQRAAAEQEIADLSQTRLHDKDGEERFRNMFGRLHPGSADRLRAAIPGISRREELLAMLISLNLSTPQIENIMCIARASINVSRYRLRTKMQLKREDSLEEALAQIVAAPGA